MEKQKKEESFSGIKDMKTGKVAYIYKSGRKSEYFLGKG